MKNVIPQPEKGCFSTTSWAVGGLRYGEKLISTEVSGKLREDDFFQRFLTGMKDWRRAYSFSNCSGQVTVFWEVVYNNLFKNRGENKGPQRLVDNGCHCRKQLLGHSIIKASLIIETACNEEEKSLEIVWTIQNLYYMLTCLASGGLRRGWRRRN